MDIHILISSNFILGKRSQERQKLKLKLKLKSFIQSKKVQSIKIVITHFGFTKSHTHLCEKSDEKIVLWSVFNNLNTREISIQE